jgi:hypothetical protein
MNWRLPITAAAVALAAGCAPQGGFPSLAPRPGEQQDWTEEPVRIAPAVASDAAMRQRLVALRGQAAQGERAFEADYGPAEAAIGRAGGEGSDSWVEAQQALSRLQAAQSEVTEALDQLEQVALARAQEPTNAEDLAAIDAARNAVAGIVAAQNARVARLAGRLNR